ncbi:uncharacterized protein LOC111636945 [Centruroides sculpturatus]|uniref:uncharacterized protein LOC111636945 n=1 Tax=Centruroides sculpturatus TaxID=218467 RepID=UPI000C6D2045|nr:uncharacterized protein LOC111636945 [Centruroides sculpturatus]
MCNLASPAKKYRTLILKICRNNTKLEFLTECRVHNLFPMSIWRVRLPHGCASLIPKLRTICLRKAIRNVRRRKFVLQNELIELENELYDYDPKILTEVNARVITLAAQVTERCKKRYRNKMIWIVKHQKDRFKESITPRIICWDNIDLPTFVKEASKYGPKYAPIPVIKQDRLIPDIEQALEGLSETKKEMFRWEVALKIKHDECKRDRDPIWPCIRKTQKWIRSNNIVLTRADKSKDMVVMKRTTYDHLLSAYIKDTCCTIAPPNAVGKLQARVKRFATTPLAKELGMKNIVVQSPSTPRLFGFAKTHKKKKEIRPVVDKACAPTILLEKWVHNFVRQHGPNNPYSVKQPIEVLNKMANINSQEVKYMTVLDYKALYPSVKLEPCFCHLRDLLLSKIPSPEKKRKHILDLAHLTVFSALFSFKDVTYTQKKGVAMGSPLAGTLCEMVLTTLENAVLPKYEAQMIMYARYVDDVLIFWNTQPNIQSFIKDINDNRFGLEIELEQENDKIIHFLDLHIQINNVRDFTTKVYRKPSYNPIFIPWSSHDPPAYKIAAFRTLISRAYSHCNNTKDRNEELNYIYNLARKHGVNLKAIINKSNRSIKRRNLPHNEGVLTMEYNASLNNIFRRIGKAQNKRIVYKRTPTTYQLLRSDKDLVDRRTLPGVYKIPVTDSRRRSKLMYVGATGRCIKDRLAEHQANIRKKQPCTALATYVLADQQDVKVEWDQARLMQIVRDKKHRHYAEAWQICKAKHKGLAVNFRESTKISAAWSSSLI